MSKPIRMLDIDLDAFLNGVKHFVSGKRRLSSKVFKPWSEQDLRTYLERNLLLSRDAKIPGRFKIEHDAALPYWRELAAGSGNQLEVCHIDGHANLGMGDASWAHITAEYLPLHISGRSSPPNGHRGLNAGSYLAYAVAERLVSGLEYVFPEGGGNDLPPVYFLNNDPASGRMQLKEFSAADIQTVDYDDLTANMALSIEPDIPFLLVPIVKHAARRPFDIGFVCQSPGYTPKSADRLLRVISEYIEFDAASDPLP